MKVQNGATVLDPAFHAFASHQIRISVLAGSDIVCTQGPVGKRKSQKSSSRQRLVVLETSRANNILALDVIGFNCC
jgi:hypothetical protein